MNVSTKLTLLTLFPVMICSVTSAALIGSMADLNPTTVYDGSGAVVGQVTNYDNGLPTNANPGLIPFLGHSSATGIFRDTAVLQVGGTVAWDEFSMRAGPAWTESSSIYVIDDVNNVNFEYKNLEIADHVSFWTQHAGGGGQELTLLNGYASIGELRANAYDGESTINIGNGKLEIESISNAVNLNVNMLTDGTGEIIMADGDGAILDEMNLNFEIGSSASFTILKDSTFAGDDARGFWDDYVTSGSVFIDGVSVSDVNLFNIQDVGLTGTSISLAP